jgi:hypothetical protein
LSHFESLASDILGIILIGAEGCAEVQDEHWLRDATTEERMLFIAFCKDMVRKSKGEKAATNFDFAEFAVDGTGRPYWLKAVLDRPETPAIAHEKAHKYTRVLRVHDV